MDNFESNLNNTTFLSLLFSFPGEFPLNPPLFWNIWCLGDFFWNWVWNKNKKIFQKTNCLYTYVNHVEFYLTQAALWKIESDTYYVYLSFFMPGIPREDHLGKRNSSFHFLDSSRIWENMWSIWHLYFKSKSISWLPVPISLFQFRIFCPYFDLFFYCKKDTGLKKLICPWSKKIYILKFCGSLTS